ncbi:hypothetical protein B0A48_16024 [Cryoendolithus antarcticus]|uniref:Uncharacterized protein n=1 Tax=Cryoendolithus antarcticus TaxID=1507870 RepID=A0A1V8SEX7_9PEZI|nr:hypothetical protein B0A48_16024 [Cryoendolithus antarcticus]
MPHGRAARERNWKQASKAKTQAKKEARRAVKTTQMGSQSCVHEQQLVVPTVTEDDLLAFQFFHFGDDTKPETFFVSAEQALGDPLELQIADDPDGLGWYDDGAKRSLTDEQIAMFRHSEMVALQNAQNADGANDDNAEYEPQAIDTPDVLELDPRLPRSRDSSLEPELRAFASTKHKHAKPRPAPRQQSQSSRSESSHATNCSSKDKRKRKEEVPYDERHKRKWEKYVEKQYPVEGARTHRRLVRELDELKSASVELDY